jgi:AcrR family transcriptional regulator
MFVAHGPLHLLCSRRIGEAAVRPLKARRSVKGKPNRASPGPKPAGREAILKAAIVEFANKGFDGASTAGIARAAGVAQPLVHHHFESKEKLWLAVMETLFQRVEELGLRLVDDLAFVEPARQLEMVIRKFVLFTADAPELARIMVEEGAKPGPRLDLLVERFVRPISALFEPAYERGVEQGTLKALPKEALLFVVIGAASHLFTVPALAEALGLRDRSEPGGARAIADVVAEVVFRGLCRQP